MLDKKTTENYTRNGWRRCKTTLETSGKDKKTHTKQVENIGRYTRNEEEDIKLHSK
jgi:hypothetical protein